MVSGLFGRESVEPDFVDSALVVLELGVSVVQGVALEPDVNVRCHDSGCGKCLK